LPTQVLPTAVRALVLLANDDARTKMVDLNGNGNRDIWEWLYNANGINPNTAADGDGFDFVAITITVADGFQLLLSAL
jgi:hypothetical protein